MAPNADPWRTLGLAPGATRDEIRRAYRRLAKANHPDAAGEAALPRFLAIQSAYEQLAGPGRVRRVVGRPSARPTDPRPTADAGEPWRADPDRARASGRADGRRMPGARPAGTGSRSEAGHGPAAGAAAGAGAPSERPDGAAPGTGSDGEPVGGRARRSSNRRRPANRATPGSTSYEGADEEPFEPGWTGGTWYGASSGTYWTINPKEYADPRKHGPEYQARARRGRDGRVPDVSASGGAADGPGATAADPPPAGRSWAPPSASAAGTGTAAAGTGTAPADGRRPGSGSTAGPAPDAPASSSGNGTWTATARGASARAADGPAASPTASGHPAARPGAASPRPGDRHGPPRPPGGRLRSWIEQPEPGTFRGPLLRRPTTSSGRLAIALLGWVPLGVFVTAAIDRTTGCGSYSAACPEVYAPGTWLVQAAILFLLVALPRLASWSAHGAIAALVAGVPSAVALSAAGGSNVRDTSGPILLGVLAIAYLAGVVYAIAATRRLRSA